MGIRMNRTAIFYVIRLHDRRSRVFENGFWVWRDCILKFCYEWNQSLLFSALRRNSNWTDHRLSELLELGIFPKYSLKVWFPNNWVLLDHGDTFFQIEFSFRICFLFDQIQNRSRIEKVGIQFSKIDKAHS